MNHMISPARPPPISADLPPFSQTAASTTKNPAVARPALTQNISVSDRLSALIWAVCGLEHAAATISNTRPADTMNVTASRPPTMAPKAAILLLPAAQQHLGDHEGGDQEHEPDADEVAELDIGFHAAWHGISSICSGGVGGAADPRSGCLDGVGEPGERGVGGDDEEQPGEALGDLLRAALIEQG